MLPLQGLEENLWMPNPSVALIGLVGAGFVLFVQQPKSRTPVANRRWSALDGLLLLDRSVLLKLVYLFEDLLQFRLRGIG